MTELAKGRCEPCNKGAPRLSMGEAAVLLREVPEWMIIERDGEKQLSREFTFPDFLRALAFTNRIGGLAEEEGHHPALLTEWGRVTVRWWTHKIGGLHRNDFMMAAKTDQAFQSWSSGG